MTGPEDPPRGARTAADELALLDELPRLVRAYLQESRRGEVPVVEQLPAAELRRRLDLALGPTACSDGELLELVRDYLRHAVRTAHPQFHNQLFSGFSLASFLGEVVCALTNTTMATFEASPAGTLVEAEVLARLRRAVAGGSDAWTAGGGILCTGGSNANLLGLLCARQHAFPEASLRGLAPGVVPRAYVSDQAHYSFAKSMKVLGLGTQNLVVVASDASGRMRPEALEQAVAADRSAGHAPFFVGATSGTTVVGAYDPLDALADVASRHGLWLHADGAWGGSALLSPRHRALLAGSERCDSFAWDAHKMLGASLPCSAFLARDAAVLRQATAAEERDTAYLLHGGDDAELDTGRSSLQCGRRVDALKLFLLWKRHGDAGLAARVDHLFELADLARALVERHPRLELVARGQAPNVCFRWLPAGGREPDAFNVALRERLRAGGRALVNYARVGERLAIRLVLSNADLEPAHVEAFFERLTQAATELEREHEESGPRAAQTSGTCC